MLSRLRSLWRNLSHRDRDDRDLHDEVRAVFDILVDEKNRAGMTPQAARRAATIELGHEAAITQQVREERAGASIDGLLKDIRYGAGRLGANPGFTVVVVLSLAIGIGANSAMFSVANALLLRALPVPEPATLFSARYDARVPVPPQVSFPFFEQLRATYPGADGLAAMSRVMRVQARSGGEEPSMVNLQLVSGEFFDTLRLRTSLGRLFGPDDNRRPGAHPVAVISAAHWRRRFNAAIDIVGRDVVVNGARFTIIGVAPEGFSGVWLESPVDVWLTLAMQADVRYIGNFSAANADMEQAWMPQDGIRWIELLARAERADGREAAALNAVLRPILLREADTAADPERRRALLDQSLVLEPFSRGASALRDRVRTPLFVLMGMVTLLLLVACVNTANLMLARAASRQREMAVRLSLGASRSRIMSQLLTESALLSALAAVAGLAMAPIAGELLVRMSMGMDSGPLPFSVPIDGRVQALTEAVAMATTQLFGIAPAWRASDPALASTLRTHARSTRSGARLNLQKRLVVAQVALSLLLVAASALFRRSLNNLATMPLGFEPDLVVSASINPRVGGYAPADLDVLYRRVIERVEALPGVEAAAVGTCGLMTGCRSNAYGLVIAGYAPQPGEDITVQENRVSGGYVRTAGLSMVDGRDFTARDHGTRVAIINEAMAHRYFGSRNPIGQRIGRDDVADTEIIGVVKDARLNSVREAAVPMALFPIDQQPSYLGTLLVRTRSDPGSLVLGLRRAIHEIEPSLPVDRVITVGALAAGTFRQERLVARLTTLMGLIALTLACLGVYGLMSYAVKQRTPELAIRFALGAQRPSVLWMVFRESMLLMIAGVVIGVPVILASSRLLGTLLFDVSVSDPVIVGGAVAILLLVGTTASYIPSWRASRVDPLTALRQE